MMMWRKWLLTLGHTQAPHQHPVEQGQWTPALD